MNEYISNITVCQSREDALKIVEDEVNRHKICVISFINAHSVNLAENSGDFKTALLNSTLLFRDGVGLKFMFNIFRTPAGENLNGTDLIPLLLERYKGESLMTIGTRDPFLSSANSRISANGSNIVGSLDGFKRFDEMLYVVNEHKPKVVLLGMGMPKQELFSQYLVKNYPGDLLIINGGAILDFYGEKFSRAPAFFRKTGLEWLFRLLIEPKRLFRRYVIGNPIFVARLIYERYFKA
jgi:N-acetylglucosaminyldiphosphoundecaprenol N-acetyl-beta-D-mannosaminyltransferase